MAHLPHCLARQAIRLAELARHELGLVLSPGLVLRSADVETLVDSLDAEVQEKWLT